MSRFIYITNSELIKLRKQNETLKEQNKELRKDINNNLKAWEEMSRILHYKQDVVEEIEELKVMANNFLMAYKMAPVAELNIPPRLRAILIKKNISFVSEDNCFVCHNFNRFRSIGKKSREIINLALIEYHK